MGTRARDTSFTCHEGGSEWTTIFLRLTDQGGRETRSSPRAPSIAIEGEVSTNEPTGASTEPLLVRAYIARSYERDVYRALEKRK